MHLRTMSLVQEDGELAAPKTYVITVENTLVASSQCVLGDRRERLNRNLNFDQVVFDMEQPLTFSSKHLIKLVASRSLQRR